MGKYGKCALLAINLLHKGRFTDPKDAWETAMDELSKDKPCQIKSCPKNIFLGLCEEGLVIGVKPGGHSKSIQNKEYGIKAIEYLQNHDDNISQKRLWDIVTDGKKVQNCQMDVVLTLWKANLIKKNK